MDDEARELELIKQQLETMNVNWGEGIMAGPPAARQGGRGGRSAMTGPAANAAGPGRGNGGRGGARQPPSQVHPPCCREFDARSWLRKLFLRLKQHTSTVVVGGFIETESYLAAG